MIYNIETYSEFITRILKKIPYILILWEKEQNSGWVSVRVFKTKEQYEQSFEEFLNAMKEKCKNPENMFLEDDDY